MQENVHAVEEAVDRQRTGEPENETRESHIELGRRGELAARHFLERKGFEILETNWSCIAGEVDIIARDDASIHFVEVKTRRGTGKGFPLEAITPEKRLRYERIAELYLQDYDAADMNVSFDAIGINTTGPNRALMKVVFNAFSSDRF